MGGAFWAEGEVEAKAGCSVGGGGCLGHHGSMGRKHSSHCKVLLLPVMGVDPGEGQRVPRVIPICQALAWPAPNLSQSEHVISWL